MKNFRTLLQATEKLEEVYKQYKAALSIAKDTRDLFSRLVVLKGFEEYIEQPVVEEAPFDDLMIEWGGKTMYHEEIIARIGEKGYISPCDFIGGQTEGTPLLLEQVATDKKKYEKRNCVSIKWTHPENGKFYFSVGVSLYARGYGWSARASDGERYYWKRGHYYETDKKAAFFALSSLLDWLGKPTDRIGKCMRLAIWTNREQYNLKQMELFE